VTEIDAETAVDRTANVRRRRPTDEEIMAAIVELADDGFRDRREDLTSLILFQEPAVETFAFGSWTNFGIQPSRPHIGRRPVLTRGSTPEEAVRFAAFRNQTSGIDGLF
jgi:hypothetical protein